MLAPRRCMHCREMTRSKPQRFVFHAERGRQRDQVIIQRLGIHDAFEAKVSQGG